MHVLQPIILIIMMRTYVKMDWEHLNYCFRIAEIVIFIIYTFASKVADATLNPVSCRKDSTTMESPR